MALINLGAGLSEAGKNVAAFTGAWTLEAQKADAAKEMAVLADQLSGARESTGRREAHGYATELQDARLKAEAPEREARTASLRSGTGLANRKEEREVAAGEGVSGILTGRSGDSYAARVGGYEGGTKNGGMVANELGSGAYGPYQFMPSTWADVRRANPELNLPEDIKQATGEQHKAAFDKFTAKNAEVLKGAGIEPTAANLYLAHRFGAGGAQALIKADDSARLADVLPADWQRQNPDMRGQTVGGFKRLAEERMKGVAMEGGGTAPDTMPAELRASISAVARTNPEKALQMLTEFHLESAKERARQAAATVTKPPEGYRKTPEGNLVAIPGGPADTNTEKPRDIPSGYRRGVDGNLEAIPGGPEDTDVKKRNAEAKRAENEKAIPQTVTKGMQENLTAIRQIDKTLNILDQKPDSVGGIGSIIASSVPGAGSIQNRFGDPEGTQLRALIADIGSLKIHDRSGAAVTVSEFPRLRPFIPTISDDPKTIKTKLGNFRAEYENILSDTMNYYSKENGFKPYTSAEEYLKSTTASPPPPNYDAAQPKETTIQQARDALAKNAPRAAVEKRLRDMGIDPSVLR